MCDERAAVGTSKEEIHEEADTGYRGGSSAPGDRASVESCRCDDDHDAGWPAWRDRRRGGHRPGPLVRLASVAPVLGLLPSGLLGLGLAAVSSLASLASLAPVAPLVVMIGGPHGPAETQHPKLKGAAHSLPPFFVWQPNGSASRCCAFSSAGAEDRIDEACPGVRQREPARLEDVPLQEETGNREAVGDVSR
jgi:hypothetical protein